MLHGFCHGSFYSTGQVLAQAAAIQLCYTEAGMKVLVLYRPNSEHGRLVEEFIREFQMRHQDERLEVLNIDTRDGSATASLYDVVRYPAILILQADGYLQKMWEGEQLPLMEEVVSYAHA